jgi:hypothetical protein
MCLYLGGTSFVVKLLKGCEYAVTYNYPFKTSKGESCAFCKMRVSVVVWRVLYLFNWWYKDVEAVPDGRYCKVKFLLGNALESRTLASTI